jgi:hypothetical protein
VPPSRVRRILQLLAHATAEPHLACDVQALLRSRITQAVALRAALRLPSPHTNVYRLINRYACAAYTCLWTCLHIATIQACWPTDTTHTMGGVQRR